MGKSLVSCFLTYSVQYISFHSTVRQTFEAVSGRTGELLWTYSGAATGDGVIDVMRLSHHTQPPSLLFTAKI